MQNSNRLFSYLISIGLIGILACVVFLVVQRSSLEKTLSSALQNNAQCAERKQFAEAKIQILESNVILSAQSTGKRIDETILLTDVNNNKHLAKNVFTGKTPYVIFRYSHGGCAPCINVAFEQLQRLKELVDPNKLRILIIPNDMTLKQMVAENTRLKNQFAFYLTDRDGLELPIDQKFVHYLMLVDENKTSQILIVDTMFQTLLKNYVDMLIEKYK